MNLFTLIVSHFFSQSTLSKSESESHGAVEMRTPRIVPVTEVNMADAKMILRCEKTKLYDLLNAGKLQSFIKSKTRYVTMISLLDYLKNEKAMKAKHNTSKRRH